MKTITICGSMKFLEEMKNARNILERNGFEVLLPNDFEHLNLTGETAQTKIEFDFIKIHYKKILDSHAILVLNYDKNGVSNYIGGSAFLEIGFAFTNKREIFLLNPIPEMAYSSEIEAMQPIILNNNLNEIGNYYKKLSNSYLSSKSPIKLRATDFGFRDAGKFMNICGLKIPSGISEQPFSFEETYKGAFNRLQNLKKEICNEKYEYLISIESGNTRFPHSDKLFEITVCIIEDKNGLQKVGIESCVSVPDEMAKLVPSEYPDFGVLVQEKYNAKEKDPIKYLTKGLLERDDLIRLAVKSAICQFE